MNWADLFIVLVWCHWLADFGLQSDTMALRKNWKNDEKIEKAWIQKNPHVPYQSTWMYYLIAHGFIHGAVIYLFTGIIWIALVESILHIMIDLLKTSEYTNIHGDQFLHLITKIIYVLFFLVLGGV